MKRLAETPKAENAACEAVVAEYRAWLGQNQAPAVALKLCDEIRARIALRRLFEPPAAGEGE